MQHVLGSCSLLLWVALLLPSVNRPQSYCALGFSPSHNNPTRENTIRPPSSALSVSSPTVKNPLTNRIIAVGKDAYLDILQQGSWVYHDGSLQQLDLELLRNYQESQQTKLKKEEEPFDLTKCLYGSNQGEEFTPTIEQWYPLEATRVNAGQDGNPAAGGESSIPQHQQELLIDQLLFAHKPSSFHCVPPRDMTQPSLSKMIKQTYGPNAKPCHRLDRDTSGIVLFGLTAASHAAVSKQFELRTTSKSYLALIAGHPSEDSGVVDLPIGKVKTPEGYNRWATPTGDTNTDKDIQKPRDAVTKWKVQERFTVEGAKFTRIELEPQTGRGHQLRLHMKAMGHPLLGDTLHAPDAVAFCSPRLCLHAYRLQVDWEDLRIEATSLRPF